MENDRELRQAVIDELSSKPSLVDEKISVAVSDGDVTLGGEVSSFLEKYHAEHAARCVEGVQKVESDLSVKTCKPIAESESLCRITPVDDQR